MKWAFPFHGAAHHSRHKGRRVERRQWIHHMDAEQAIIPEENRLAREGKGMLKSIVLKSAAVLCVGLAVALDGCSRPGSTGNPAIVFFYVDDCYKCDRMKSVLSELLAENRSLAVAFYKMEANQRLLSRLSQQHALGTKLAVLVIFVGDRAIVGDGRAQELALRGAVEACAATSACGSPLD